jgi:hypothetical protein
LEHCYHVTIRFSYHSVSPSCVSRCSIAPDLATSIRNNVLHAAIVLSKSKGGAFGLGCELMGHFRIVEQTLTRRLFSSTEVTL